MGKEQLTRDQVVERLDYHSVSGNFFSRLTGKRVGSKNKKGYITLNIMGRTYLAHRVAWLVVTGSWPKGEIDHKDRVRDHNWFSNLQDGSHQQNCWNFGPRGITGVRGVSVCSRSGRYRVQVQVDGKSRSFGSYECLELAALVAEEARAKMYKI